MNIYELIALPEDEQKKVMDAAFEAASHEDIEMFDNYCDINSNVRQKLVDLIRLLVNILDLSDTY